MPAGVPFAGKIADFILMKAVLRERLPRKLVHIALNFLIRKSQLSRSDIAADRRSFLNNQTVTGEMRGGERNRGLQRFPHIRNGLRRQAEHQVQVDIIKSRFTRNFYGSDHFLPIMDPADEPQETRLPCLRTDGQPVNTRFAQRLRKGRRECSRVAFAGDLGTLFNWECFKQGIQDACYLELVQKRGRAPAQENRIRFRDAPFLRRAVLSPGQRHPHSAGYPPRAPRTMQSRNTRTCLRKRARARKARSADAKIHACYTEFTSPTSSCPTSLLLGKWPTKQDVVELSLVEIQSIQEPCKAVVTDETSNACDSPLVGIKICGEWKKRR